MLRFTVVRFILWGENMGCHEGGRRGDRKRQEVRSWFTITNFYVACVCSQYNANSDWLVKAWQPHGKCAQLGPGSSPGQGHCIVFLRGTLLSQYLSPPRCKNG